MSGLWYPNDTTPTPSPERFYPHDHPTTYRTQPDRWTQVRYQGGTFTIATPAPQPAQPVITRLWQAAAAGLIGLIGGGLLGLLAITTGAI